MKPLSKFIIVLSTFLLLATSIHAQSPIEQLTQMVEQLQKTPNDNALRERIIKLGTEIKPAPAVPEEARRSFVEGVTIVKAAKDVGSQKLAIGSFTEALKIAPWWGDAYYNLAVAQELTGQLNDAERTLKWFLLTNPGESDAREAQDRIYGLSAKRKLAAAEAGAKQEQMDREMAAQVQRFEGDWFRDIRYAGAQARITLIIRRDAGGAWRMKIVQNAPDTEYTRAHVSETPYYDTQFIGTELRSKVDSIVRSLHDRDKITATYKVSATVSADGNTIRLTETPMPLNAWQEAWWANLGSRPRPRVDEYMKQ